jgi:hypothetical protein
MRAEGLIGRYVGRAVFFGRFVSVLRESIAWVPGLAGCRGRGSCSGMPSAGSWARGLGALAYFGGKALADAVSRYGLYAGAAIVVVAVAIATGSRLIARLTVPRAESELGQTKGFRAPSPARQLSRLIGSSCEWPPGLVVPDFVGALRAALGRRQRADPIAAARAPELRQGTVVSSGRRRRFSFGLELERQRCPVLSLHPRATGLGYPVSPGKALCRYFLSRPRRCAMSCASVVISSPLGEQ